jgi:hypothetical protein
MTAKQCDGGSGQRRTNDRGNDEQLRPPWCALHDQFFTQAPGCRGMWWCEYGVQVVPTQ